MAQKPSIPKGTRDFGPQEMAERNYIFDTIRSVFRTYGYVQIETPSMENLSTLLGKYGDEGDKLSSASSTVARPSPASTSKDSGSRTAASTARRSPSRYAKRASATT